jgi:N-acetylglucosaminyldiphosphoundecaprenol N-acetyl-beta-D-mannosaminyltransferase
LDTFDIGADAVTILGVPVTPLTLDDLIQTVVHIIQSRQRTQVLYANIHTLNTAYQDPELQHIMKEADIVYCDGEGVKLGARLLGSTLPERMTGADWIYDLVEACQKWKYLLYFLGGRPGVAEDAAEKLRQRYPRIQIAGTHHGYYDHWGPENGNLIDHINSIRPNILLVGFGTPLQEKWIAHNFDRLNVSVVWAVGALVDFVSGRVPRAPTWMTNHGLEWLGRFMVEPHRLWKRYLIGNPLFLWRVLKQRWGWYPPKRG